MSRPAVQRGSFVTRTAIWIPVTVIVLLVLPMALTSRSFGHDWTLHLWLVRQQQWNIEATGHPGLFVSAKPLGAFYPIFAFVGSGIYSAGGYLAIALGDRPVLAYKLLYVSGLCLAYAGFTWLSVQRGLRGWRSQVAGLVFVTEAYFVTDLAGRGDLGEFMALASIPFLLAASYAVATSPRIRLPHLLAVVFAAFVFTGSHNVTLLWGSVFIALLLVVALVAWSPRSGSRRAWKHTGALLGCVAIGAGLNAWYLFPDVAYSLDTYVAKVSHGKPPAVIDHFNLFLDPLRPAYSSLYRDIRMSLPWLFILWAIIVSVALRRGADRRFTTLFVGVVTIIGVHVVLVFAQTPWTWLPHVLWNVQFAWRLGAYVLLATALLVMLALERHATARGSVRHRAAVALAVLLVFNAGAATWQVWRVRSAYIHGARVVSTNDTFVDTVVASRDVTPPSWRDYNSFRDVSARAITVPTGRVLTVPLAAVHGSRFSGTLAVPDGRAPFETNISAGPRFVRMTGIKAVGRTARGFVVAARDPRVPLLGPIAVTITPTETALLRTGDTVSIVSAAALVSLILWPLRRFLHRRPAPRAFARTDEPA